MSKIKDFDKFLTEKTGLNAKEREEWRQCMKKLAEKQKNMPEVLKLLGSPSYWKSKYKGKFKGKK